MYGWMGTVLRVDLTSGKITKEPLSEELRRNYVGGRGINVRILYNEVKSGTDAFDPENRLIFGTGPLTGTLLASGRLNITAVSPMTNILGDSNGGSHFSPELKFAGYDHIVFTGKADKPVYLWIDDDAVELRDAQHLWGKMTDVTERMIRKELGDPRIQISCIGPAGEKMVRLAVVAVGSDGTCGRTGMGAVMGSKNLKAVAVRGTKGVRVAQPETFRKLAKDLMQRLMKNPNYVRLSTWGTTRLLAGQEAFGAQAIRNAQQSGYFAGYHEISPETLYEKYVVKDKACFGCVNHCRSWFEIKEGPYAGERGVGIEYGQQLGFGTLLDNSYAPAIYKATNLCDQYGMDANNAGELIAAATEWYEKGFITKEDTQGIQLKWGDYETMIEMCHRIANREGIGDLLAEGGVRAAKKIGRGAEKTITHCKGALWTTSDERHSKAFLLGIATSTRGADHLRGSTAYNLDNIAPGSLELGTYEGQVMPVYRVQCISTMADSLEICKFSTTRVRMEISLKDMAEFFSVATGITVDEEGMREIADRIWTLERAFTVREGISRKDDILVGRYTDEPVHEGPLEGLRHDQEKWDRMVDEYYDVVGWDKGTGVPTRAKLESLGLKDVADELEAMGKL